MEVEGEGTSYSASLEMILTKYRDSVAHLVKMKEIKEEKERESHKRKREEDMEVCEEVSEVKRVKKDEGGGSREKQSHYGCFTKDILLALGACVGVDRGRCGRYRVSYTLF